MVVLYFSSHIVISETIIFVAYYMSHPCKFRRFKRYFFILAATLLVNVTQGYSTLHNAGANFYKVLTILQDTPRIKKPVIIKTDSGDVKRTDTLPIIDTVNLKISKDTFSAPIKYYAKDSMVVLIKNKKILLYGSTTLDYDDVALKAPYVLINQEQQELIAKGQADSTGYIEEKVSFKQNEEFLTDSLRFNFKSQKALAYNTITESGEMFVHGGLSKKVDKDIIFVKEGFITTCNLDVPHFGFRAKKIKTVANKVTITGPVHPEFEGVPLPVALPFGFFPSKKDRSGGFLPPRFTANDYLGIGLEDFGYYIAPNDYWDMQFKASVFSYGTWRIGALPTYRKRYRYSGSLRFEIMHNVTNFKGDIDYNKSNMYSIGWSHSMDSKARPGVTFMASVNASSTGFNKALPNAPAINYNNQLNSTISYSKNWEGRPFSLSLNLNHSQNNQTGLVTLGLPAVTFNMATIYPFQKKEITGAQKWYEKFGFGYSTNINNTMSFYDSVKYGGANKSLVRHLLDTANWSASHNFPIIFSLPALFNGALIISPGVSYSQTWLQKVTRYQWNSTQNKLDTLAVKGLFIQQNTGISLSASTSLFGMYKFKGGRVNAIRHSLRPNAGFSYTPNINKNHYRTFVLDTGSRKVIRYNQITGGVLENYVNLNPANINFSIDNALEMKVRSRDSTKPDEKIKLIDGFGLRGSYDVMADSMNLSDIGISFQTNLLEKINITANTALNPYKLDSAGNKLKDYAWKGGRFSLGTFTGGSVSISTNFKSKPRDPKKEEEKQKTMDEHFDDPHMQANREAEMAYMRDNPSEFVDFNIPWQVSVGYSLNLSRMPKSDYSGFRTIINSSANFNGSFSLTEKWNFSVNGNYNVNNLKLELLTLGINRDLHCWQMSINVTPVSGYSRSFSVSIYPKSSLLRDLKINRTRSFNSR